VGLAQLADDSNLPDSIKTVGAIQGRIGRDILGNEPAGRRATPTITNIICRRTRVNSLSFYATLITNLAYNYYLYPDVGDPGSVPYKHHRRDKH